MNDYRFKKMHPPDAQTETTDIQADMFMQPNFRWRFPWQHLAALLTFIYHKDKNVSFQNGKMSDTISPAPDIYKNYCISEK